MKTKKIRLIVTMITLATAVILSTTTSNAQRRTSKESRKENTETRKNERRDSRPESKSTAKPKEPSRKVENSPTNNKKLDIERIPRKVEQSNRIKQTESRNQNTRPSEEKRNRVEPGNTGINRESNRDLKQDQERVRRENPAGNRDRRENPTENRNENRPDRYTPTKDYRGSEKLWSGNDFRNSFRNDNNYYRDYKNKGHWNRNWESYRWNDQSWNDYYRGYRPYSFRNDRFYYHHPTFGDVLRRFLFKPVMFVYNRVPYYCYDGYFFTYQRQVGYVLTDLPYGIVFPELPYGYEEVYINGYLYYRIGNLFFEYVGDGFRLVFYPERYLAYR
jgi:hypothetical protein